MGARTNQVALVLCLLVLAGAIAVASEPLIPPVFGVKVQPLIAPRNGTGPSSGFGSNPGTLLIVITYNSAFSNQFTTPTVANASVSVIPEEQAPLFPVDHETNSSGELQLSLPVANYSVTFLDLPMNYSVPAEILQNGTTEVRLTITSNTYQEVFLDAPASQSNVVGAWAHGTMEVASSVTLLGSDAAFLDLYYGSGQTSVQKVQAPLVVTGSDLRFTGTAADEWISFQPEVPIALSGLSSAWLSVFGVYANVTTHGGIPVGD